MIEYKILFQLATLPARSEQLQQERHDSFNERKTVIHQETEEEDRGAQ